MSLGVVLLDLVFSFRFTAELSRRYRQVSCAPFPSVTHTVPLPPACPTRVTFVTEDEPLVRHHRSQSAVCSRVTLGVTWAQRRTTTGVHRCSVAHSGAALNVLRSPAHPPSTPATTVSTVLSFPEYRIGVIYYVAFSDLILSTSDMRLRFFHVFS